MLYVWFDLTGSAARYSHRKLYLNNLAIWKNLPRLTCGRSGVLLCKAGRPGRCHLQSRDLFNSRPIVAPLRRSARRVPPTGLPCPRSAPTPRSSPRVDADLADRPSPIEASALLASDPAGCLFIDGVMSPAAEVAALPIPAHAASIQPNR
jgi:hypothetical protein